MSSELTDVYELEPSRRVLVEASAGTGKTYTIVGIFIRLLFNWNLEAEDILAVTFSRKATGELRQRILERLRECLTVAETGVESRHRDDDFLVRFHEQLKDRKHATDKLKRAIRNFDDIQVFTIHGFCQKILQEEALSAGTPFESELQPGDELLLQAAEDFWRVFVDQHSETETGKFLLQKLVSFAESPSDLIGKHGIHPLVTKNFGKPEGNAIEDPFAFAEEVLSIRQQCKKTWRAEEQEITDILENNDISHFSRSSKKLIRNLKKFFEDEIYAIDGFDKMERLSADYLYDEGNLKKNGNPTRRHSFFELWQQYLQTTSHLPGLTEWIIRYASEDIKSRRESMLLTENKVGYNDLLKKVRDALTRPGSGLELAHKLRSRYPVALVDEFQDTDPVQYQIFKQIYPEDATEKCSLMMIGDPKQAIYAFRGADLHTYFKARKDGVSNEYTLKHNYRSTVGYIEAVNGLFSGDHGAFIEEEISYFPSEAGRPNYNDGLVTGGVQAAPLQVIGRTGVEGSKEEGTEFSFRHTVRAVVEMLDPSVKGKTMLGDRPLEAGDIAILVNSNKHAYDLQKRLKKAGIDSVTQTDQSIFDTPESNRLSRLMSAVISPTDKRAVHALALTGFFGFDLTKAAGVLQDDDSRNRLTEELFELQDLWRSRGFYSMFYNLAYQKKKLLSFTQIESTERTITNLFHLAELCSAAERENNLGPVKLHAWLKQQMKESKEEEKELQIESDQHLVKIMTIHASKGLQFPVVICPTLWQGFKPVSFSSDASDIIEYHHSETEQLHINYEREKTDRRIRAEIQSSFEQVAEDVRKAYVALTRAQVAGILIWNTHSVSNVSGLGAALTGQRAVLEAIENQVKVKENTDVSDETFLKRFEELQEKSGGLIELELVESETGESVDAQLTRSETKDLPKPKYTGRERLPLQIATESFSSIAGHGSGAEGRDRDEITDALASLLDQQGDETAKPAGRTLFTFPKGATAGTVVHKIFEDEQFDFSAVESATYGKLIEGILEEYQFEEHWVSTLQQMLVNVVHAPIPGLELSRLTNDDQVREMEFHFPTISADANRLLHCIRDGHPGRGYTGPHRFMKGFIDLIARQNGQYFIVDYKSNYLGNTPDDYSREKLREAIYSAMYDLQYHIYTVALKKYLESVDTNFDYNLNFGGVVYLFVRGIRPGSDNGIWFHKPELETITSLEEELKR